MPASAADGQTLFALSSTSAMVETIHPGESVCIIKPIGVVFEERCKAELYVHVIADFIDDGSITLELRRQQDSLETRAAILDARRSYGFKAVDQPPTEGAYFYSVYAQFAPVNPDRVSATFIFKNLQVVLLQQHS